MQSDAVIKNESATHYPVQSLRHQGRQFGTGQHWTKPWQGGWLCLRNYVNQASTAAL